VINNIEINYARNKKKEISSTSTTTIYTHTTKASRESNQKNLDEERVLNLNCEEMKKERRTEKENKKNKEINTRQKIKNIDRITQSETQFNIHENKMSNDGRKLDMVLLEKYSRSLKNNHDKGAKKEEMRMCSKILQQEKSIFSEN